jgi:hypothetical protein
MLDDPTLIGSCWSDVAVRLDGEGTIAAWARTEPAFAACHDAASLLDAWRDPRRTNGVLSALVRLAAVDGERDDDALLVLLHLLSGVVWRLVRQLSDLGPDVTTVVLAELSCQIRVYRWREWRGSVAKNLELQTRRGVLDDLLLRDRQHVDRRGLYVWPGLARDGEPLPGADAIDSIDVVDVLVWAAGRGLPVDDLQLLVDSEAARGQYGSCADERVAALRGITRRTLLRRRARTLATLRAMAPAYLADAA